MMTCCAGAPAGLDAAGNMKGTGSILGGGGVAALATALASNLAMRDRELYIKPRNLFHNLLECRGGVSPHCVAPNV